MHPVKPLIDVATAERRIAESLPALGSETVALAAALGRILRQRVHAERDQPPFDRVMMDGIAIRWTASRPAVFTIAGTQTAGTPTASLPGHDACIEVMTGAVLPPGCDCVIPIERTQRRDGGYALTEGYVPAPWQFVHPRGADCPAGEPVLDAGVRIDAPQASILAANGVSEVEVAAAPSIAVVATGDELVPVEARLQPGQIRRSNDLALLAALLAHGFNRTTRHSVTDDPESLHASLAALLERNQLLVLSGGVSMGQRDHVPACLEALGVRPVFHGVAQRPGKPLWFGIGTRGQAVFGLPGNPVSSLVCMVRYVRPALLAAMGQRPAARERVRLAVAAGPLPPLTCFLPVTVSDDGTGTALATPVASRNSGDFTSLGGTQGVVEVPVGGSTGIGASLDLHRW